jgi:hypothetical protein
VTDISEAKARLREQLDYCEELDKISGIRYPRGLQPEIALLLASHDALEEALAKANKPRWFYADDEGSPFGSVHEAIEAILDEFGPDDDFPNGRGVRRIDTMRDCEPIFAAVRILTEAEREARGDGFLFEVTECATEAEALNLLKEADQ